MYYKTEEVITSLDHEINYSKTVKQNVELVPPKVFMVVTISPGKLNK